MTYELHPLCTLFPRMLDQEFMTLTRFTGARRDGLCLAVFSASNGEKTHWDFKFFDATNGQQIESKNPISESGVGLLLDEFGGRDMWNLTPSEDVVANTIEGYVYFIQSGDIGPVKIGWTSYGVERRLTELQCGNPEVLHIRRVIDGMSLRDEFEMHKRFSHLRIRGEWFDKSVLTMGDNHA